MYRTLTPEEINLLQNQGNQAENWNRVLIADGCTLSQIRNSYFGGEVQIGMLDAGLVKSHGLALPEGIFNSYVCNSRVGAHCVLHNVRYLSNYTIGDNCLLFNVDEMSFDEHETVWMEPMNENGGRKILPFNGMTIGDAYLWARFRGQSLLMERLEQISLTARQTAAGCLGTVGNSCTVKNCKYIHNVAINSSSDDPSVVEECVALTNGVVGFGNKLEYGIIAERFLLGEHVKLEYGLRLNDSVVGDNSTLARCEVGCSIIFPAHEQHHNNSFLIAALVMGQSNVAAGGTIGSNHNSRTADNEVSAGRGFWPGLCVSIKHSSRFASYTLLAKGDYPSELNISIPFALVNNNVAKNQLEVMPAYWWLYNMYAMDRNAKKFAARDKRVYKLQHIEFDNLAPDTAEEIIVARDLLHIWTEEAYREGKSHIEAHGMEKGKRKTVILKAGEGYKAYYDMLVYYAMKNLCGESDDQLLPDERYALGERVTHWVNVGGQLVSENDVKLMISDIEKGSLASWNDIHQRFDQLWSSYDESKRQHAYHVLCYLSQKLSLDPEEWNGYLRDYQRIRQYVADQKILSRKKDEASEFRKMTYWSDAEMHAVLD